ncbi:MAG: hypothetical protein L0H63_09830, partial [Nitrococcus sp.]|nr:hypothetical protein [Nitrococcus sp.]
THPIEWNACGKMRGTRTPINYSRSPKQKDGEREVDKLQAGIEFSIDSRNAQAHIDDLANLPKVPHCDPKMPTTSSSSFVQP